MKITLQNFTPYPIWVVTTIHDEKSCGRDGDWATSGWYKMNPFRATWFYTDNRFSYFYAESSMGHIWSGSYGPICVWQHAFDGCLGICDTQATDIVGMRLIDADRSRTRNLLL